MRRVSAESISKTVSRLAVEAACNLGERNLSALRRALRRERSATGKYILKQLLQNAAIARRERMPICQDTGLAIVFVRMGDGVHITGGTLASAVNEGVRRGYVGGFLRKSVVRSPLDRVNTCDNTPAVIHTEIIPGDRIRIDFLAKGAGSENMSRVRMLTPAEGMEGVCAFVEEAVREAGGNPCPPLVVGVGIGGNLELAPLLAKKSLLRPLGRPNRDPEAAKLERQLLKKINALGIGPGGLGGNVTALAVHVETFPCHIASLPVAVNLDCHAHRHKWAVI